jgi:hypothetical protein
VDPEIIAIGAALIEDDAPGLPDVVEMRASRYFGLIDGSPPGVPGGGMTGIGSPEGGGICFIKRSISAGGAITPPERAKSELVVPLNGGVIGRFGLALSGRWSGSAARAAIAPNPTAAAAMRQVPRIAASSSLSSSKPEWRSAAALRHLDSRRFQPPM